MAAAGADHGLLDGVDAQMNAADLAGHHPRDGGLAGRRQAGHDDEHPPLSQPPIPATSERCGVIAPRRSDVRR